MRWIYGTLLLLAALGIQGLTDEARAECRVLSSDPAYTAGQLKDLTCGTDGTLKVGGGPGSATAASPTLVEGGAGYFSFDLGGNVRVTLGTCISGESTCKGDSPDSYIMVRPVMLSSGQKTGDAQILAGPGYVSHMTCQGTDAAATAGTIILHDALTETGTAIFTFTVAALDYHAPIVFPVLANFATGIYLGYTTTADVNCTVFYNNP